MKQIFIDIFKRHLLKEEEILWFGRPNVNKIFSKKDAYSIFVGIGFVASSLVWIVFGIRIMSGVMVQNTNKPMPWQVCFLLAIPFVVVGFYNLIGKAIIRKHKKEKTFYAITNKRLLILEVGAKERIISKYISRINKVDAIIRNNGMGTIEFGENYPDSEFSDINDVQNVYELIDNLRSKTN
ncbi:hypothetical protein [Clostridium sp. C2-6-12]|uniref:hypothetical protein n=1 Tax=Clostridium sp. C2-6-12 TaxID=2698832 RepID=UPI00136BCA13|nr:hypothetical protein [Clostridium sp. C2-6-12]